MLANVRRSAAKLFMKPTNNNKFLMKSVSALTHIPRISWMLHCRCCLFSSRLTSNYYERSFLQQLLFLLQQLQLKATWRHLTEKQKLSVTDWRKRLRISAGWVAACWRTTRKRRSAQKSPAKSSPRSDDNRKSEIMCLRQTSVLASGSGVVRRQRLSLSIAQNSAVFVGLVHLQSVSPLNPN